MFASWESSPPLHTRHEDIFPHFCCFYFPIYTMSFIIDTRWMRIIYNTITKFGHQIYHSCFLLFLPRLKLHFHMQHYSFKAYLNLQKENYLFFNIFSNWLYNRLIFSKRMHDFNGYFKECQKLFSKKSSSTLMIFFKS